MSKPTLKNAIERKGGYYCRICNKRIKLGEEISILVGSNLELEKSLRHACIPHIHVYHRDCMDDYLLARLQMGKPVSAKRKE